MGSAASLGLLQEELRRQNFEAPIPLQKLPEELEAERCAQDLCEKERMEMERKEELAKMQKEVDEQLKKLDTVANDKSLGVIVRKKAKRSAEKIRNEDPVSLRRAKNDFQKARLQRRMAQEVTDIANAEAFAARLAHTKAANEAARIKRAASAIAQKRPAHEFSELKREIVRLRSLARRLYQQSQPCRLSIGESPIETVIEVSCSKMQLDGYKVFESERTQIVEGVRLNRAWSSNHVTRIRKRAESGLHSLLICDRPAGTKRSRSLFSKNGILTEILSELDGLPDFPLRAVISRIDYSPAADQYKLYYLRSLHSHLGKPPNNRQYEEAGENTDEDMNDHFIEETVEGKKVIIDVLRGLVYSQDEVDTAGFLALVGTAKDEGDFP
eukprot:g1285.t1